MKEINDEIKISISKTKAILLISVATGILVVTSWFLTKVLMLEPDFNRTYLLVICSAFIITFGLVCISGIKRLMNSGQGLLINNKGIEINIGPFSGHFINWDEITEIKIYNPYGGRMSLLIIIKNPDELISKTFGLSRILLRMNTRLQKTPVSLTTDWFDCSFETLVKIVTDGFEKYNAQQLSKNA